ncbi:MAG: hypothetical protein H7839_20535 [Magnetococcus sp. YQC-5]
MSLCSGMVSAAGSRSMTLQVEYKSTQEKLGSFGIILSGPDGMTFPEQSCTYQGSDYGEFKYNQNRVILGGFSDGIGPGILMTCQFDLKTEFTLADFSIILHVLADPKRVSLLNKLSAGTDFVLKDITLQTKTTPPTVTISSPIDNFVFNKYDPLTEINGTIADPSNVGIDKLELQITYDAFDGTIDRTRTYYLVEQSGRLKSRSTPAWIPASISDDLKTWAYSIDYDWVDEKVYSVTARVTDKAGHPPTTTKPIHVTYTENILVSGTILDGYGKPIPDVKITFTDKSKHILYTNDFGKYSWQVPSPGWSGTVTLEKPGYTFSPSSRVLTSISANQFNHNFAATAVSEQDARAIIVAGGDLNDYLWTATNKAANLAYTALRHKGITRPNIKYFSMDVNQDLDKDSISDIDGLASSVALKDAILTWAGGYVGNNKPLIIYLVGHGREGEFYVSKPTSGEPDIVTATMLNGWLDDLQTKTSAKVILIVDACYSGSFMKPLVSPAGMQRIVIASAEATERAYFSYDGSISFSNYFWNNILQQKSLQASFNSSAKATLFFSTSETPQHSVMDANSDGHYNNNIDPKLVSDTYLGASPDLKEVFPEIVETISNSYLEKEGIDLTLWVQVNLDPNKIARVWGVVTLPETASEVGTASEGKDPIMLDQPALDLTYNQITKRYETLFKTTWFGDKSGRYSVTFFAQTKESDRWVSLPKSITIQVGQDMYEPNNTPDQARIIVINSDTAQHHNTHAREDVDWVKFYAIQGVKYEATASKLGKNANLVMELYDTDGETRIDRAQTGIPGEEVTLPFTPSKDGIYFIKVKQYSMIIFGDHTEYDLKLSWPYAPIMIPFTVLLTNELNKPMAGAKIKTGENETALTDGQGRFTLLSKQNAPDLTINDGYQIKLTGKTLSIKRPVLDVDKNGFVDATDGVLLLRKLTGASTIDTGILLPDGETNHSIVTTINAIYSKLDVDQSGTTDATDGVLMLRKLTGASTLVTGVLLPSGQNNSTVMTAIENLSK